MREECSLENSMLALQEARWEHSSLSVGRSRSLRSVMQQVAHLTIARLVKAKLDVGRWGRDYLTREVYRVQLRYRVFPKKYLG